MLALCVGVIMLGVSHGLWWLACSVKRLSNKIHYPGECYRLLRACFILIIAYSLFWRGNLPFLLVWCVPSHSDALIHLLKKESKVHLSCVLVTGLPSVRTAGFRSPPLQVSY